MAAERDPERLLSEAVDAIALGYPFEGSETEKAQWLSWLRGLLENRAPVVREQMRRILRDPD
jgi:hypothetical protein